MTKEKDEDEEPKTHFVVSALLGGVVILLTNWISPGHIPFSTADIFSTRGTGPVTWLLASWPIFVWAVGVNVLVNWKETTLSTYSKSEILWHGFKISALAGVVEELAFRWLIFLASFTYIGIFNFLFFGWLGFGVSEFLYEYIFGPIANFTTFGALSTQLDGSNWLVGASVLAANATFRDGHRYQGILGIINSWFIGMYLFWVMFKYGLLAAIFVHFSYDMLIFVTLAFVVKKRLRWA